LRTKMAALDGPGHTGALGFEGGREEDCINGWSSLEQKVLTWFASVLTVLPLSLEDGGPSSNNP
jgi:hypothetical protein